MSISLRKALPLSLLLLVCLCLFLLPTAHADGLEDLENAVERRDESFTVTEDMTIPEGVHLQAWDTAITVQKGKTLTIQGTINTSKLNINGTVTLENWGFLYASQISLGSAGRLNITGNNYMRTDYEQSKGLIGDGRINFGNTHNVLYMDVHTNSILEFNNAFNTLKTIQPEHFVGYLRVCNSMILDSGTVDMNSGKPVAMEIADGATLTVPTGTTLNAYEIYIEGSSGASTLKVNGKLYGNTEIRIREGGKLICANDSCFVSNGACIRLEHSGNPNTQIQGLNLNRFSRFDQGNDILFIDSDGLFAQFKAACQSGAQYFDLSNKGRFQISESITIPAGMTVDATGTDFIVPVGNSVTVNGKLILTGWNLFGQANSIMIPEGGELHIAAWHGLAVHIWGAWVKDGSVARVTFAENAGVTLGAEVNNDQQLHDVFADFVEAIHNEHVNYEIRVAFPCTLSESAVIPGHIRMTMFEGLTVPENVTLTNNGTITALSDAVMTINGTLVNNNFVEMEKRTTTGAMLRVNGTYSGIGTIGIKDHDEVESYISGIDLSNYEAVPDNIGTRFFYTGSLFPALKDAIARGESDFNMRNCGTVLFAESITIPNTTKVHASGTEIVIPNGVTLTVESYCRVGALTVQSGGHVTVANKSNANLRIDDALNYSNVNQFTVNRYMEIGDRLWRNDLNNLSFGEKGTLAVTSHVTSDEELQAAMAMKPAFPSKSFQRNIHIEYDWELYDDLDIQGFSIYVDEPDSSLTIKRSAALTIHNRLRVKDGHLQIEGAVINHGEFLVQRDERPTGALVTMGETGNFVGTKPIAVFGNNPDSCLEGFDLNLFKKELVPGGGGMDVTIYSLAEQPLFTELKAAIANGETNFNMNNRGTLLITEDVTIPANMRLTANENCAVVVAGGAMLTVDGNCGIRLFDVLDGGYVTVSEGAYFGVSNVLTYVRVDQFTVNGSFEVFEPAWTDELKNLSLGEKADFELGITAKNEDALMAALARDYHFPNKKFTKNVTVLFDWILSQDYTISDVHIDIGFDGSLTIPEGKTLINSDTLRAQDGPIYLQGTLINYGQFFIHPDKSTGALLIRSGNGYYGGRELVVHADMGKRDACLSGFDLSKFDTYVGAWGTSYFPPKDLVLPGSLQTLEAEAFTDGSFRSVLIPPSIRSIAPTAFGDMTGLVIYGASGTAAEQFAADHGHYFVNMQ